MNFTLNLKFTIGLFLLLPVLLSAQKNPSYGKVDKETLRIETCPIDSNAKAYFIFDYGEVYFDFDQETTGGAGVFERSKGFHTLYTRHFKIKILDKDIANEWANITIPIYHSDGSKEELVSIRATTFNLEKGKVKKTKFNKKEVQEEKASKNWNQLKFAMHDVKDGSVIEVTYTIKSEFLYTMPTWKFQHNIPALSSEYHTYLIDYFKYNHSLTGYHPIKVENEVENGTFRVNESYSYQTNKMGETTRVASNSGNNISERFNNVTHYYGRNIPALNKEAYLKLIDNYITKVDIELAYTTNNRNVKQYYTKSWESLSNQLANDEDFLMGLKTRTYLNKDVEIIKSSGLEGVELVSHAFDYYKNKIQWNKRTSKYRTTRLREAYVEGSGSSGDINLGLINLMDQLGFQVYPVLVSTQSNGFIYPNRPTLSGFNYVIALVRYNEKDYLLDATSPWAELNLLPIRCLNGQGRLIDESFGEWIDLQNINNFKRQTIYQLKLDDDLNFSGIIRYSSANYAAYNKRNKINSYSNHQEYVNKIVEDTEGLTIDKFEIKNSKKLYSNVIETFNVNIENQIEDAGELILFSPMLFEAIDENPFKVENRSYPVEYNYPSTHFESFQFEIPEGYAIEAVPDPISVSLPENAGTYKYNITVQGNKIQVLSVLNLKKSTFSPEEYPILKQFYNLIVKKQEEKIALKVL